jgi:hypothetical protein
MDATVTATEALARMGMTPRPYTAKCQFGRSHLWVRPAGAEECEDYCARCGSLSSLAEAESEGGVLQGADDLLAAVERFEHAAALGESRQ